MKSKSLELISAVAGGNAKREDVVAALKAEGIDSLDVLIDVLTAASRGRPKPVPTSLLDPGRATRERVKSVHKIPHLPFMLNGTVYDPADIKRFDGQELHLIGGSADSPILAIDDRETFDRWVQYDYISTADTVAIVQSLADKLAAQLAKYDDGLAVSTTAHPSARVPIPSFPSPGGPIGPGPTPGYGGPARTIFYEDIDYGGCSIECPRNRGFYDLTEISFTFLGTGDWNDTISSYATTIPLRVVLWEHIRWTGSSYTNFGGSQNLVGVGWNDRASSVECW